MSDIDTSSDVSFDLSSEDDDCASDYTISDIDSDTDSESVEM